MNADDKLNKESKINIGIYAIKITLYNNLGKPVDLNPKMFVFPDGSSLKSELNSHPYLSSNIKYNTRKLDKLTHQECIQTFFNKRTFINFLRDEPILKNDKLEENKTIQSNVETMLEYIFPMSFPVIKIIKRKSAPTTLGFIKAFKKEFFKKKHNTFLNIGGKTNTVDGITILDTFSTNPAYIKAYEYIQKYKQQVIVAYEDIFQQLEKLQDKLFKAIEQMNNDKDKNLKSHDDKKYKIGTEEELIFISSFNTKFTFNPGSANPIDLVKMKKDMDSNINSIESKKLDQDNFQTNYKLLRTALKKYKDFLEETMKELFPDKKLYKEDEIKKHYRDFYDKTYRDLRLILDILKLVKVCEFLASISYLESYNKNISTYGIIPSVDMKKFGFYKKMLDEMKDYYFPKRESLDKTVKDLFNTGEFGNEIDIVEIDKMYNNSSKSVTVDVDKIDLNVEDRNAPRYNIQVQISIFGGMVSDKIKKFIKCKYEEQKLGADIGMYIVDSEQSEYFDLTNEIAKIEQKMKAPKKGKKTDNVNQRNDNQRNDNQKNDIPMVSNPLNNRMEQTQEDKLKSSSKMTDSAQTKVSSLLNKLKEDLQAKNEKDKNNKEYETDIRYVTEKNATLISDEEFIKEFNSNPDIIKFVNLSEDTEFDMNTNANSQIEEEYFNKIKSAVQLKMDNTATKRRDGNNSADEKNKLELEYTKYELMMLVLKGIHDENKKNKGYNKVKTGGKKTRQLRRSRSLRRTRKLRKH